jgi:hypothetical protein
MYKIKSKQIMTKLKYISKARKEQQIQKEKEFDLLSNIGGILGLFIGVSFVTLFEIGELLIEILLFIFKRKNNNKTVQVAPIR